MSFHCRTNKMPTAHRPSPYCSTGAFLIDYLNRLVKYVKAGGLGAAIAQWIRLHLPSCCPGFWAQAHQICFYQFKFKLCLVEKTKINQRGRDFFYIICQCGIWILILWTQGCEFETLHRIMYWITGLRP